MTRRAILISIVLFAIASLLLALPTIPWQKHDRFLPEQVETTLMVDTSQQQLAQQVWVLMIAIACATILLRPQK